MIFILRIFSLVSFPIVYLKITPCCVLLIVQKRACKSTDIEKVHFLNFLGGNESA